MSAATARYEDTAVARLHQLRPGRRGQGGARRYARRRPAGAVDRGAVQPGRRDPGRATVTVRDVAGLYIYDNTLLGVELTGAQVKEYLEYSARVLQAGPRPGPFRPPTVTNAVTPTAPNGTPDYNYDIMGGLDAAADLRHRHRPAGRQRDHRPRVRRGARRPAPSSSSIAINNYRQSGGGNFPHVTTAPVVYNRQVEIRQLLIDWVSANQVVDPAVFSSTNPDWQLTSGGTPLTVTP